MPLYRYSRWDGTQKIDLDADDLLDAMADDLLHDGDPLARPAAAACSRARARPRAGGCPGLKDLLEKLRRQKQQRMQRYDLGSSLDDIKKKLEEVVKTERAGHRSSACRRASERAEREQKLDALPPDPAGRCASCRSTTSSIPRPSSKFEELLDSLRQQMMQPHVRRHAAGDAEHDAARPQGACAR